MSPNVRYKDSCDGQKVERMCAPLHPGAFPLGFDSVHRNHSPLGHIAERERERERERRLKGGGRQHKSVVNNQWKSGNGSCGKWPTNGAWERTTTLRGESKTQGKVKT